MSAEVGVGRKRKEEGGRGDGGQEKGGRKQTPGFPQVISVLSKMYDFITIAL